MAYQYTWWEMYPTNAIQVVGQTLAAGDAITSTVTQERHELHAYRHRLDALREQLY